MQELILNADGLSCWIGADFDRLNCELQNYDRVFILCDENTQLYTSKITDHLKTVWHVEMTESGEGQKSLRCLETILEKAALFCTRKSVIVTMGGGVCSDLGGFIASILFRGMDYYIVATSLLGMVDSSIGGKTGVNLRAGKNMAGSFWLPRGVVFFMDSLQTLPEREFYSGYGELIKTAVIDGEPFLKRVETKLQTSYISDLGGIEELILKAASVKISVVSRDFREGCFRQVLNFGHTFGHALEAYWRYRVPHGVCVLTGMILETRLACSLGADAWALMGVLHGIKKKFPFEIFEEDIRFLIPYMWADKKNKGDRIYFTLYQKPGVLVDPEHVTVGLSEKQLIDIFGAGK